MNKKFLISLLLALIAITPAHAQDAGGDLSIESLKANEAVIIGKQIRLYVTVKNNSGQDLLGTVKFYDETKGTFIGNDEPVSIVGNGTDEVFVDWMAESVGDKTITARVSPWEKNGDDEKNNKITTTIYVDVDSDGDGIPNRQDPDDDNDGKNDEEDAFPEDPNETEDSDGDGIGNNADEDDDNDGTPDVEDRFPADPKETDDRDKDGVGDNSDAFPDDPKESVDEDGDGIGKNKDVDDTNLGPQPKIILEDSVIMIESSVELDASGSKDSDGKIAKYEWSFGKDFNTSGEKIEKEFKEAGNYKVTLKVTDDKGEFRTSEVSITVIHWWQSLPAVLTVIILFIVLIAVLIYKFRKKSNKGKNALPKKIN